MTAVKSAREGFDGMIRQKRKRVTLGTGHLKLFSRGQKEERMKQSGESPWEPGAPAREAASTSREPQIERERQGQKLYLEK